MRNDRRHYTAEEKVAILKRHPLDKVPISNLCEELGLEPTVFYRWHEVSRRKGRVYLTVVYDLERRVLTEELGKSAFARCAPSAWTYGPPTPIWRANMRPRRRFCSIVFISSYICKKRSMKWRSEVRR